MAALKAPDHHAPATRKWWVLMHGDYSLESWQSRLLTLAGESWDRCEQARERIQAEGLTIEGREGGLRPHPCIAIERDSRASFGKLIAQLDLETDTPAKSVGRPLAKSWPEIGA